MIHPTAVIDPKTELDSDVSVGPYALIEGNVRIGSGTDIQGHAVISGQTFIGKNNRVGYGVIIGSFPQDLSFDPRVSSGVEIGDNNVIREYCTIHRGTKEGSNTVVGSNNLFMVGAHLGHNTRIADHCHLGKQCVACGLRRTSRQSLCWRRKCRASVYSHGRGFTTAGNLRSRKRYSSIFDCDRQELCSRAQRHRSTAGGI
jgi:UDP-3-O-[3-hydroxymyristoyl] glucosamine N-acyltransferase